MGLNLTDGTETCARVVTGLREVGYVGLGQSLDYDDRTDTLVLSGLFGNGTTAGHAVFRSPATGCGPFTRAGTYGDAEYIPMLYSSTLDAEGQRLFVLLATVKNGPTTVGVVDLTRKMPMRTMAEGTPAPDDVLVGMHFDSATQSLFGITANQQAGGLVLHALGVDGGKWAAPKKIADVPPRWNALYGNEATVSTFDAATRSMYFIAGTQDGQGNIVAEDLAAVNVDDATLVSHPKLSPVGLGGSGLQALAMAGSD